jgi:class 3 adenylate cyclase
MDPAAIAGIAAGAVAVAGAVVGITRALAQGPLLVKATELEARQLDLTGELARERERYVALNGAYEALKRDLVNARLGNTDIFLKYEIESSVRNAMDMLEVSESSILVPGPGRTSSRFVFLSIHGPASEKLRKAKLPIDKGIVGRVFASGKIHNTVNAYNDPNFFSGIDAKGGHQTTALLTLPLCHDGVTIGVLQFLNKPSGFSRADERRAEQLAKPLASKVATFIGTPANFELVGLAWQEQDEEATIVFCDLTSSSTLLSEMNAPSAVDCINEYLENQCDIALGFGATVDKYTGDGVMIRFNVPRPITDGDHVVRAVEAAAKMLESYVRLREGWIVGGLPVQGIFNRIGISCGTVYEAKIGHPQFHQITVIGEPVNEAAVLCERASRSHNVIVMRDRVYDCLPEPLRRLCHRNDSFLPPAYEIRS